MNSKRRGEKTHEQHLMERKGEILSAIQRMKDPFVMFEFLPAGGMERSRRARIISANSSMKELTGLSFTEMMAYQMQTYMPDIGAEWFPVIGGVALSGKTRMLPGTSWKDGQERDYIVLCVQPVSGYCACFLLPADGARNREYDLILTDVDMPKMPGSELAEKIRSVYPHAEVFYVTGEEKFEFEKLGIDIKRCLYENELFRFGSFGNELRL